MILLSLFQPTAENITLGILLVTQIFGGVVWYTSSMQKRFASETEWKKTIQNQKEIYKLIGDLKGSIEQLRETINDHEDEAYKRYFEGVNRIDKELVELKSSVQNLAFILRPPQPPNSGWGRDQQP